MTPLHSTPTSTHSHNSPPSSSSGSYIQQQNLGGVSYLPQNHPSRSYPPHNSPIISHSDTFQPQNSPSSSSSLLPHNSPSSSNSSPFLPRSGPNRMHTQTLQLSPRSPTDQSLLAAHSPHTPLANHPHSPSACSIQWSSSATSSPASHQGSGVQHPATDQTDAESQSNPSGPLLAGIQLSKQDVIFYWKCVMQDPDNQPIIPQHMYRPHTQSDRRRYVEDVELGDAVHFYTHEGLGVWLPDALHARMKLLQEPETHVLQGRGPSVSIRLEVRSSSRTLRVSMTDRHSLFSGQGMLNGADRSQQRILGVHLAP